MKLPISFQCTAPALLFLGFASGMTLPVFAQDKAVLASPPVLQITREYVKPGKTGAHEKSEIAFARGMSDGKVKDRYYALTSQSGPSRALFVSSYASFAAMEEARKEMDSNSALSATLDRLDSADGELLSETDSSTWFRRDDLSLNTGYRVGSRYESFSLFTIRPGHLSEWEELVKLVIEGYKKGVPEAHWGTYQQAYGSPGGAFLVLITIRSGAELDSNFASDKKFTDAMGEEGMKKLEKLEASCVESRQTNLFRINPAMSYPPDALVQAEPDFWKVKP
jgi:hypothetical protein